MSVTPRGMSVTEAYRIYQDNQFVVNRQYQRKLVWTEAEKAKLIDSILEGFPIPLILLAEHPAEHPKGRYEVIDGVQRLNAIFSFIENAYPLNGKYFDISEFTRANQAAENGNFEPAPEGSEKLSPTECANILDYQLAVTIFPAFNDDAVTDIFGRINSQGRQLSNQDRRQAGVITPFAEFVRELSAELRGDISQQIVQLADMPVISVDAPTFRLGYGIRAEDTFWCKQGIIRMPRLRDSEDEEFVADLVASILLGTPLAVSRRKLDEIYSVGSKIHDKLNSKLAAYPASVLTQEMKTTFSVMQETIEKVDASPNSLRKTVNPNAGSNPIKTPFFAIFMAFFQLVVREQKQPTEPLGILGALKGMATKLEVGRRYVATEDRERNINLTLGLIRKYFAYVDPPLLEHGPGLALDLENSLKRSQIETPRYEFKQGLHRLSTEREKDENLVKRLAEISCSLANIGSDSTGFIFLGVADEESDADRIHQLDNINPIKVDHVHVVGIDREARLNGISVEQYVRNLITELQKTALSDPLKTQLLSRIDTIEYRSLSVVRITVPPQTQMSWVGDETFIRIGSETQKATGKQIMSITQKFTSTSSQ